MQILRLLTPPLLPEGGSGGNTYGQPKDEEYQAHMGHVAGLFDPYQNLVNDSRPYFRETTQEFDIHAFSLATEAEMESIDYVA